MAGHYLTGHERRSLRHQMHRAQDSFEFRRIQTLLVLDKIQNFAEVSRLLQVSRSSIYRWLHRYLRKKSADALQDHRNHSGRPKSYSQKHLDLLAKAIKQTPQDFGYIETGWNVGLLRDFLAQEAHIQVSKSTLRRQLHELNVAWNRFGRKLDPDADREKKTPYP